MPYLFHIREYTSAPFSLTLIARLRVITLVGTAFISFAFLISIMKFAIFLAPEETVL